MTTTTTQEVHLISRPTTEPTPENFKLVKTETPTLQKGQILVKNTWMSVDPYMRGRMDDVPSHILPPFTLNAPLEGSAIGEVVASEAEQIPVGATVSHFLGWRQHAVLNAAEATIIDTTIAPPTAYLGALGTTGLTAYATLTDIAPVREGDVVFISAAAGAVGSVAGQLARKFGAAKVIGSAGGPAKTKKLLEDFGFDAAIDYRAGDLPGQLKVAAPDGIDVYIDNVGGDHLEAAIDALRVGGRVGLVGAVSGYNDATPAPGPNNLFKIVEKQLHLRGIQVSAYFPKFPEFIEKAVGWLKDGSLHTEETVFAGLDQAPAAFLGVLSGVNTGKMLVRLSD